MKRPSGRYTDAEIQRVKDDNRISDVVGRFVTWDMRKSNPGRGDWWACCPFHGEKAASFHCEDQKGRYHCFGCGAGGNVIKFLREKVGLTFPEAMAELGGEAEKSQPTDEERARQKRQHEARIAAAKAKEVEEERDTREFAHKLWSECRPLAATIAEEYLRKRGADFDFSFPALRFHPAMRYGPTKTQHPCLVAAVQAPDDRFLGIWRIYLTPEAENLRAADGAKVKLGLGAYTEAGGCVRLGKAQGTGHVTEGIETGFGVLGLTGMQTVLCALNTSGMKSLIPPPGIDRLLIWPDGDVDKIRRVKRGEEEEERIVRSPGISAARILKARMDSAEFPTTIQPTPKRGRDYLDIYNASRKVFYE